MFKGTQKISRLTLRLLTALTIPLSLGLDASDPCSGRKFCGNLRIVFNGAGENLSTDPNNRGVDPAAKDTVQFLDSITNSNAKNTKVVVLSSDKTQAVANSISKAKKKLGKDFVHIPTSKASFEGYLQNDAALEALKQSFMSDPDCAEMVKPGEDISKYVKVDVFVASHSEKDAKGKVVLPVWPTDSDSGEDDKYREIHSAAKQSGTSNPSTYVDGSDFEQLRQKFSGSVFQALPITCDGAAVAELILPSETDSCSCYAAYTDDGVVSVRDPFDNKGVLGEAFQALGSRPDKKDAFSSLHSFSMPMHNYNRFRNFGIQSGDTPIFDVETDKPNHFDLFSVSSDERYSAEVSNALAPTSASGVVTKLIVSDPEFEVAYREVSSLISKKEVQNQRFLSGIQRDPNALKEHRLKARDYYNSCFYGVGKVEEKCAQMQKIREEIFANQDKNNLYQEAATGLTQVVKDLSSMADMPLLDGKNNDPMANYKLFSTFWKNYEKFDQAFASAARDMGVLQDIAPALDEMRTKFAIFYATYIHAYFPDVVKDSLDRRVEKLKQAADALRMQYAQTNDPKYKKQLQRLRTHLACTLNFPFGPNYREVNEYPVGTLVVDASESSSSQGPINPKHKKQQQQQKPAETPLR